MSEVRTRFAPSPTGFLHLGSARTALFNWAYARRHSGSFILRVEDTDRQRSTAEAEAATIEALQWLGLDWDEGPLRQSERAARHAEIVEELLAADRAYRCLCTREEIEQRKQAVIAAGGSWTYDGRCRERRLGPDCGEHTVRLRVSEGEKLDWEDLVFGPSGQDSFEIGDMIIRRSDGGALYNLAVVVDDLDMGITHVIRGADHHSNTPFQIAIYRALGRRPPAFAHVPLIVGEGGKKLSKRRDPVSIQQFRDDGILPDALCNWLARIGWSHGDQEIFSLDEIASLFDLASVGRASARADADKLHALNQHYIVKRPMDELYPAVLPHLTRVGGAPVDRSAQLDALLELLRERSKTLAEMAERARWFLLDRIELDDKAARKHLRPAAGPVLTALRAQLAECSPWDERGLEVVFERVRAELGATSMGKLAQPVRVAVTGSAASPGIFETLAVLGRERSLRRIDDAIVRIDTTSGTQNA